MKKDANEKPMKLNDINDDEAKKLMECMKFEGRRQFRNWNYSEREDAIDDCSQETFITLMEQGLEIPSGVINEQTYKVHTDLEKTIKREFGNSKKRWETNKYKIQLPKTDSDVEGYINAADSSLNVGIPIEIENKNSTKRPHKASWERSQRYSMYEETYSYLEEEELGFLNDKQRGIVGAILKDPYKKDRPKGELSQRNGIIQELKITKEDYQETKEKVITNYDIAYTIPLAKPSNHSVADEDELSIFLCTSNQNQNSQSVANSDTLNTSIIYGGRSNKTDAKKQKEIELIKTSNILTYFIELADVKDFLYWVKLVNGDRPFTVWHKRTNHPYVDKKEGTHHYYSPEKTEALYIEKRAGCCGDYGTQYLCKHSNPDAIGCFTWFCWSCGDKEKDNTKHCYKTYPNTLSGFLLSLYEQRKGTVETLIRHAKEWDSQRDA
jgi:hypothetical protein